MITRILKSFLRSWRVRYAIIGALAIMLLGNVMNINPDLVSAVSAGMMFTLCTLAGWYDAGDGFHYDR